jgi:ankyrin repeat protein
MNAILRTLAPAAALSLLASCGGSPPAQPSGTVVTLPPPPPRSTSWAHAIARGTVAAFDRAGNLLTGGAHQETGGSLTKLSPEGAALWNLQVASSSLVDVSAVASDAAGDFYVCGAFQRELTIGGSTLAGGARPAIFVAKLSPDGAVVWAKAFSGAGYDAARGIAADPDGTIYVTGTFQDRLSFGGDELQAYVFRDVFVASFDPNGNHRWSTAFHAHGPIETTGSSIAVDEQGLYVAGLAETDFTFSEAGETQTTAQEPALFVVGMTRDGHLLFRKLLGGPGKSRAAGIAASTGHGFTVVGEFDGTVSVEGTTTKSAGATDALVVHYDDKGIFAWSKRFGGMGWDRGTAVAMAPDGTSYVAASVSDAIDIGPADFGRGGQDAVVAAFDDKGALSWVRRYGGEGDDVPLAIARSQAGALAVAGTFAHSLSAGVGALEGNAKSNGFALRFAGAVLPAVDAPKFVPSSDPAVARGQAFAAAERGDVESLKQLVPAVVKGDLADAQGWSLVMKAAYRGKADAVRYLCAHGADPNAALASGYTPLMQAVRWGYTDAAKALVQGGANVGASDKTHGTALHVLVDEAKDATDLVSFLIEQKAPLEAKDSRGRTPLLVALDRGNAAAAKLLLEAKANASAADETGYSALGRAATHEDADLVTELLNLGADPNAANGHGWSAVTDAAQKGNVEVVSALLAKGGNPNGPTSSKPIPRPLTIAAQAGKTDVVELLLSKGARVNEVDPDGKTAAHLAAQNGLINVLRVLKKRGANFGIKDSKGHTVNDVARPGSAKDFVDGKLK